MNINDKKVLYSIIAGVLALAVAIGVIIWKLPSIKNGCSGSGDDGTTSSQSDQSNDKNGNGKNGKDSGNNNNDNSGKDDTSSDSTAKGGTVDTGKKSIQVTDVVASTSANEIVVPIYATKNPGIIAARLFITFDTDAFSFADCEGGEICESFVGEFSKGTLVVIAQVDSDPESLKCVSGAGVIGKIILKPNKNAKAGEYTINIGDNSEFANLSDTLIPKGDIKVEAGKIVLK